MRWLSKLLWTSKDQECRIKKKKVERKLEWLLPVHVSYFSHLCLFLNSTGHLVLLRLFIYQQKLRFSWFLKWEQILRVCLLSDLYSKLTMCAYYWVFLAAGWGGCLTGFPSLVACGLQNGYLMVSYLGLEPRPRGQLLHLIIKASVLLFNISCSKCCSQGFT